MSAPQERWECPSCGTPLNIAALGIYARVACPACGHIDHVHTVLANFRIEGVLGLGGMSVVLRARDLVLERPLAIKLLNEFYRDQPERIARFEQECELMAKVRHENVVSLYSAGRVKGQFYIAMELVNGRNLEELVSEAGPLDPLRALDILRQVVQGLAAAYRAGLLHRDMKPANILLCEDDHAKVLDFGLSHGKRDADTEEIIWATPYYVPPETLMREAEDPRTDMYALGMTLRHLLTGVGNFEPVPETVEAMIECKRALPRMAEVMPALPEAYADLVDHMTAFTPADRPENYASLLEEIAEVRAALVAGRQGASLLARLKSAMPLLGGVALTLAVGAGLAAVVAAVVTPEPERLSAMPAATLPWKELELLATGMDYLEKADLREAGAHFAFMADSSMEPTACAWASLHARVIGILLGEPFGDQFFRHMGRSPVSGGQDMFDQMATLLQPDAAPADAFLQAAQALMRMEEAETACRDDEAKDCLQAARTALRAAGKPYESVLALADSYEKNLSSGLAGRARRLYITAFTSLDMPEAARALDLLGSSLGVDVSRQPLEVQKEALMLYTEAVEMMRRRSLLPAAGERVSTPRHLRELLGPLENPRLNAELTALMLVAMGDFEAAAAANPYARSEDSTEPFAIMMRDWMQRIAQK